LVELKKQKQIAATLKANEIEQQQPVDEEPEKQQQQQEGEEEVVEEDITDVNNDEKVEEDITDQPAVNGLSQNGFDDDNNKIEDESV
jgi:hypothetical protein